MSCQEWDPFVFARRARGASHAQGKGSQISDSLSPQAISNDCSLWLHKKKNIKKKNTALREVIRAVFVLLIAFNVKKSCNWRYHTKPQQYVPPSLSHSGENSPLNWFQTVRDPWMLWRQNRDILSPRESNCQWLRTLASILVNLSPFI